MDKIPESWREEADSLTLRVICAIDEIVEWINEHEKNNKLTMQEVIRLMDEDVRQARGGSMTQNENANI